MIYSTQIQMKNLIKYQPLTINTFRWKTMEGNLLTLAEMKTSHIFNAMKMIFNHLAALHGGNPIWFEKKYIDYKEKAKTQPNYLAALILFFIQEIEQRKNLPDKYKTPYLQILNQIEPLKELQEIKKLLT